MKPRLPQNYDNYIFDLYGTLVDIHTDEKLPALWEKMSLFYGYYGAEYSPEELHSQWNLMTEKYREESAQAAQKLSRTTRRTAQSYEVFPEIDITRVTDFLYRQKGVDAGRELIVHTGQFFRVLSTEYIRLYEGTFPMLEELHTAGKTIWLLSNAQRIFTQYELRMLKIDYCFDGILISSDYGVGKPDPFFFHQLIDQFGLDFKRSLFIGNDAVNDIGGAQGVGLDSFYVHSNLSFVKPSWTDAKPNPACRVSVQHRKKPKEETASAVMQFRLGDTCNYTVMDFTGWAAPQAAPFSSPATT